MSKKINSKKTLQKFLIGTAALFLVWLLVYESYLKHLGQPDAFLTYSTASAGRYLLSWIGYHSTASVLPQGVMLEMDQAPLLLIADNCNGLSLMVLFTAILLLLPGSKPHKAWFMPLGLLLIFLLNALRVMALVLIQLYHPEWLDFNHKYTFTALIYAVVFLLWLGWGKLQNNLKGPWAKEKLQVS